MAKFSTSKKVAKILMYFGLSVILLSGIIFGISLLNVGADDLDNPDDPESPKTSLFVNQVGSTTVIQMSNIPSGVITSTASSDLIKFEEAYQCETISAPCYQLQGSAWDNPSIFNPQRPAWAYLLEAKKRAFDGYGRAGAGVGNDETAYSLINKVIGQYVTASYSAWDVVKWETNQITINSVDLINTARGTQVPLANVNGEVTVSEPNSTVIMTLADVYTMATEDSLWLKSADFLLGSVFDQWEKAFRDYSVGVESISDNKTRLLTYISKYENSILLNNQNQQNGSLLSMTNPTTVSVTSPEGNKPFAGKIHWTSYPLNNTENGGNGTYDMKIFIKPYDKRDQPYHIWFNPAQSTTTNGEFKDFDFDWSRISGSSYVGSDGSTAIPQSVVDSNAPYYDLSYPQKYTFKVVLYKIGEPGSIKEDMSGTFDSINPSWNGSEPATGSSSILQISAQPRAAGQGTKIIATITVTKNVTPPIAAVVMYACNGSSPGPDSSNCTLSGPGGEDLPAIKGSWSNFSYNAQNKAVITGEWLTGGSSIGAHSLMVKAYAPEGTTGPEVSFNNYINDSKASATVNISNSRIAAVGEHQTDPRFSGLLSGLFTEKASEKDRGSSIVSFGQLIDKILLYSAGLIGLIAFFVILIAGIQYMTAGGNEAQTTKAKNAILYALLGIALYVLSYGIIFNVVHIIRDITGAGSGDSGAINLSTLLQGDPTGFDLDTAFRAAERLISIAVSFAAIVGFVMIIWASILYVTSVGDENKAETAKKTLIWSIAGTFIVSLAGFIVDLVDRFFA